MANSKSHIEPIDIRQLVYQYGKKYTYESNTMLLKPGELVTDFNYIDEGTARCLITSSSGAEYIINTFNKGRFFGVLHLSLEDYMESISIITETPVILYKIDKNTYMDLIKSSNAFRDLIIIGMARLTIGLISTINSLSFDSSKERLYNFFLNSADRKYPTDDVWHKLKNKYTQDDLAKFIGVSRMTIYKIIKELSDEELIRNINGKIEIKLE